MATDWRPTPEQSLAVGLRGANLLVSAAAGAGKTKVLVERVISRVTGGVPGIEPIDLDRLLVVTFTEAAALEMRERIASALREALEDLERGEAAGPDHAPGRSGPDPASGRSGRDSRLDHLRRQAALLGRASISTLHSFCLGVCRRHFHSLGLDPAFEVLSQEEADLLRNEVLEEVLEELYEAADPAFLELAEAYGGERDDRALRQAVLKLEAFSRSHPDPAAWLDRVAAAFEPDPGVPFLRTGFGRILLGDVEFTLLELAERLRLAETLASRPGGPAVYVPALAAEAARLTAAARRCREGGLARWEDLARLLAGAADFATLPAARTRTSGDAPDPAPAERLKRAVRDQREAVKKSLRKLVESFSSRTEADVLDELRRLAVPVRTLTRVVTAFGDAYRRAKDDRAALDFGDLEHLCLRALESGAALEVRERFAEVLIDEYQDINAVQEAVLNHVSREDNLFMVGDVKQSIYRFRLAEPELFMRKAELYVPVGPDETGEATGTAGAAGAGVTAGPGGPASPQAPGRKVVLPHNFRSRRPILDAVNYVFRQVMWTDAGMEIDYDASAELVYGAGETYGAEGESGPAVELHLVEHASPDPGNGSPLAEAGSAPAQNASPVIEPGPAEEAGPEGPDEAEPVSEGDDGDGPTLEDLDAIEREAHVIARRIRDIVGTDPVFDRDLDGGRGGYRPAAYRDIVVLLRATAGLANRVLDVLNRHDIPAHAQLSTGYFAATEVETVLCLLRLIDNPRQDIPLAAVLRSPVVGLDETDLARVRLARREGDYYDAVLAAAGTAGEGGSQPEPDQGEPLACRLRAFLESLDAWRTAARRGPLSDLVARLYRDTGFYAYAGGLPGGRQRQANLRTLHDRARQFDQFSRQGLARFLRFIDRLREDEGDLGPPPALGEGEDVVRVMSVHRSKGLEFPVVFLAQAGRSFNLADSRGDLLYHRHLGLGPMVVDLERRLKYPSVAHQAVARACERDTVAEELRILYVAMTRARDRLVLVGGARDLRAKLAYWCLPPAPGGGPDGARLSPGRVARARCYLDWLVPALASHPDAAGLREAAGYGGPGPDAPAPASAGAVPGPGRKPDTSRWNIRLWGPPDAPGFEPVPLDTGPAPAPPERDELIDWERVARREPLPGVGRTAVSEALDWSYPHHRLTGLAAKVAPTELKRLREHWHAEEAGVGGETGAPATGPTGPAGPAGSAETAGPSGPTGPSPIDRGRATHLLLQHVDLSRPPDAASLARLAASLAEGEFMTAEQAAAVDIEAVARFFASDLGRWLVEMASAVKRELPFTMALPDEGIYGPALAGVTGAGGSGAGGSGAGGSGAGGSGAGGPGAAGSDEARPDTVLVQGIIDALVVEPDGLTLIDFKTDRVEPPEVPARAELYRTQVDLYRRAVEAVWRRPVKASWMVFLTPGVAHRL